MRRDFKIVVRVIDWGSFFSRELEIYFYFYLQNINDNSLLFEKVNCFGYLFREVFLGIDIVIILVVDFDYSDFIYYIKFGNEDGCFEVDVSLGRLMLNCSLEVYILDECQIIIVVSDGKFDFDLVFVSLILVNNKKNMQLLNKDVNV